MNPHPHVLRGTGDPPLEEADVRRRGAKLGIGDEFRFDKLDDLTACLDRRGPGGEDVLHPLHVRPIGQEEEVVVASLEDVDRRLVLVSRLPAGVRQDGEAGEPPREGAGDRVYVAVHAATDAPHAGPTMSTLVGFAHQGETIRTRDAQAIVDEQDTGIADAAGLPVVAKREAWIVSKEKLALHASPDTLERVVVERENKVSERLKEAWVVSLMDTVTALEGFDPTRVLDLGERVVGEATPVHRV